MNSCFNDGDPRPFDTFFLLVTLRLLPLLLITRLVPFPPTLSSSSSSSLLWFSITSGTGVGDTEELGVGVGVAEALGVGVGVTEALGVGALRSGEIIRMELGDELGVGENEGSGEILILELGVGMYP